MQIHTCDPVERNSKLSVLWESKSKNLGSTWTRSHSLWRRRCVCRLLRRKSAIGVWHGKRDAWRRRDGECWHWEGGQRAWRESVKGKNSELSEYIISHAKWARFWMAPNARPGECWIWWCFKNTNPQWVFSSVLYSRCYLLCKTTTATHTFSTAPSPNTGALYLSVQLRDYKRRRSL